MHLHIDLASGAGLSNIFLASSKGALSELPADACLCSYHSLQPLVPQEDSDYRWRLYLFNVLPFSQPGSDGKNQRSGCTNQECIQFQFVLLAPALLFFPEGLQAVNRIWCCHSFLRKPRHTAGCLVLCTFGPGGIAWGRRGPYLSQQPKVMLVFPLWSRNRLAPGLDSWKPPQTRLVCAESQRWSCVYLVSLQRRVFFLPVNPPQLH